MRYAISLTLEHSFDLAVSSVEHLSLQNFEAKESPQKPLLQYARSCSHRVIALHCTFMNRTPLRFDAMNVLDFKPLLPFD